MRLWVGTFLLLLSCWFSVESTAWAQQAGEQFVLTESGVPSGVTALTLDKMLRKADLRQGIEACVKKAYEEDVRIYGTLRFTFLLHQGGGVQGIKFAKSAFERMGLPHCIDREIQKRLHGQGKGLAAFVVGWMEVEPGLETEFGFSLSADLSPRQAKAPSALSGNFGASLDGPVSVCSLGSAMLVLRLSSLGAQTRKSFWSRQGDVPQSIEQCLLLAERTKPSKARRRSRRSRRRSARRLVADCLKGVLKTGKWQDKAYAAEEIADSWRYRARREIRKTVQDTLQFAECDAHSSRASCKNSIDCPGEANVCYVAPRSSLKGHALVRMLRAQLRLGLKPAAGVLASLAQHPDPHVRLRLVDTVLSRWNKGLPEGLSLLIHDRDPRVSTRAQQIGCIRSDWESLHAFEDTLANTDPVLRAMAVLNARACAAKDLEYLMNAVKKEKEPVLKMLMLRAMPLGETDLVLEYLGPALFDPCPAVRYLALGLVARLSQPPIDLLLQLRGRERDPFIIKEADRLIDGAKKPRSTWEQVWLVPKSSKKKHMNLVRKDEADVGMDSVGKLTQSHPMSAESMSAE